MNKTNQNEQNSSIKQALLDLKRVAYESPDDGAPKVTKAVNALLKVLEQNPKLLREADKVFNQRRYNEKKLNFTKVKNFKKSQIVFALTDRECRILLYMFGFMSQQNMVAIKQTEVAKELKTAKRDVNTALKELERKGCITKLFTDRKGGLGTIYMVNPEIASVGKHENNHLFQKITPSEQLNEFLTKTNNCTYGVTSSNTSYTLSDNTSLDVRYNYLINPD